MRDTVFIAFRAWRIASPSLPRVTWRPVVSPYAPCEIEFALARHWSRQIITNIDVYRRKTHLVLRYQFSGDQADDACTDCDAALCWRNRNATTWQCRGLAPYQTGHDRTRTPSSLRARLMSCSLNMPYRKPVSRMLHATANSRSGFRARHFLNPTL